jgi:hypothetical protein
MIRFLTLLLELLHRFFESEDRAKAKLEGRQETLKEMNDALNAAWEEAEAAVSIPDPERDERLRARFDRSRRSEDGQ